MLFFGCVGFFWVAFLAWVRLPKLCHVVQVADIVSFVDVDVGCFWLF